MKKLKRSECKFCVTRAVALLAAAVLILPSGCVVQKNVTSGSSAERVSKAEINQKNDDSSKSASVLSDSSAAKTANASKVASQKTQTAAFDNSQNANDAESHEKNGSLPTLAAFDLKKQADLITPHYTSAPSKALKQKLSIIKKRTRFEVGSPDKITEFVNEVPYMYACLEYDEKSYQKFVRDNAEKDVSKVGLSPKQQLNSYKDGTLFFDNEIDGKTVRSGNPLYYPLKKTQLQKENPKEVLNIFEDSMPKVGYCEIVDKADVRPNEDAKTESERYQDYYSLNGKIVTVLAQRPGYEGFAFGFKTADGQYRVYISLECAKLYGLQTAGKLPAEIYGK